MKKVVNSVLASALALTVAPMVVGAEEAAAPKMDPALEKTVKRLEALGLVQGYGNGEYGVDRTITRAEFATLIVRARGLEQGAKLAQFQSNFTDVKANDWFAGFVNVASGQEIVKGYTDKTFKPQNQVTYAEAVAMIIRALGYEPSVKGVWPNNYVAKASELGIASKISAPNNAATRGDIFKMLDNALSVDLMEQTEYGTDIRFNVTDETLLTKYLDVSVYDMEWTSDEDEDLPFVSAVPVVELGRLKKNEVEFDKVKSTSDAPKGKYKVADGINPNDFAGQQVQVWIKEGREDLVVWMEGSEDQEVITSTTTTFYLNGKVVNEVADVADDAKVEDMSLELGNGKTYDFSSTAAVTYNYNPVTSSTYTDSNDVVRALRQIAADEDARGAFSVKVVLDDEGKIAYLSVVDHAAADKDDTGKLFGKFGSEVVEKVDTEKKTISILEGSSTKEKFELEGDEGEDFLVILNGQSATLADLKPMDVFNVYYPKGDTDKFLVVATRNVVEGKVTDVRVVTSGDGGDNRIKIGDKEYRFRSASYSENGGKDIEEKISTDQIRDLDGVEVKLYLDATGRVRHIETKENVDDRRFKGILVRDVYFNGDEYTFSVLDAKGTKRSVKIDEIEDENGNELSHDEILEKLTLADDNKVVFLEVELDSAGKEKNVKLIDSSNFGSLADEDWDKAADEDDLVFSVNGNSYDVDKSTVFVTGDVSDDSRKELEDADIVTFKDIADEEDITVHYLIEDNEVEYFFVTEGDVIQGDGQYGYVLDMRQSGGTGYVKVLTKVDGQFKEVEYKMDGSVDDAEDEFAINDFIRFSVDGNNEFEIDSVVQIIDTDQGDYESVRFDNFDAAEAKLENVYAAKVIDVDGNSITIETKGGLRFETSVGSTTSYFNVDGEIINSVDEGDYVALVETDDDGSRLDYVLLVADEETVEEEGTQASMDAFIAHRDVDADLVTDLAVKAVNDADTDAEVKAAIEASALGLNLTKYNALDATQQTNVRAAVLTGKPYATKAAIQSKVDTEADKQVAKADLEAAVAAVNNAVDEAALETALKDAKLGLNLTKFEALTVSEKADVLTAVLAGKTYADKAAIQAKVDSEADKAVEATAVDAVNSATTSAAMRTALEAKKLGLNLTEYNKLTVTQQGTVVDAILADVQAGTTFDDKAEVQAALDAEVAAIN